MSRQIRKDDPALDPAIDLAAHAKAVLAGRAQLDPGSRLLMIALIGTPADRNATDAAVCRVYLAALAAFKEAR